MNLVESMPPRVSSALPTSIGLRYVENRAKYTTGTEDCQEDEARGGQVQVARTFQPLLDKTSKQTRSFARSRRAETYAVDEVPLQINAENTLSNYKV